MGECFRMTDINRFIQIVEDFKIIRDRTQLQITPDALFTNARALFISEQIAQQRGYNNHNQGQTNPEPATEKQIKFLKALKINIPNNLTKQQAFLMIKQKKGEYENENN